MSELVVWNIIALSYNNIRANRWKRRLLCRIKRARHCRWWRWISQKITSRSNIRLFLGINSALLGCRTDHWSELAWIPHALLHLKNWSWHLATWNHLLDRHVTSTKMGVINEHSWNNSVSFIRRPIVDIRGECVWVCHWERILDRVDRVIVGWPDLCLWNNVPLWRHKGLKIKNLVFVLVKHFVNLARGFSIVRICDQHLWDYVWQEKTVSFPETSE